MSENSRIKIRLEADAYVCGEWFDEGTYEAETEFHFEGRGEYFLSPWAAAHGEAWSGNAVYLGGCSSLEELKAAVAEVLSEFREETSDPLWLFGAVAQKG